jgi:hypothetical protein
MQDVIGLFIINLVVPRIIVLSAANFESNICQLYPDYFTYFLHIRIYLFIYLFILHLYLSIFCDTKISFLVWYSAA